MSKLSQTSFRIFAAAGTLICILASPVSAQAPQNAEMDYKASMEKMDAAMMKGMDPDPTKAWAKMMVAHHQGAIDMSMTVLKVTKDQIIREMAEKSIKDQTEEQKKLQAWIDKH